MAPSWAGQTTTSAQFFDPKSPKAQKHGHLRTKKAQLPRLPTCAPGPVLLESSPPATQHAAGPLNLQLNASIWRQMQTASKTLAGLAPVAQLDRAPDYESGGREVESSSARQSSQSLKDDEKPS